MSDAYEELKRLRQQIEDTIAVAETESDSDGFITAYHFKTGAIHRLLAEARKGDGHVAREALSEFKREMEERVIPKIVDDVQRRNLHPVLSRNP